MLESIGKAVTSLSSFLFVSNPHFGADDEEINIPKRTLPTTVELNQPHRVFTEQDLLYVLKASTYVFHVNKILHPGYGRQEMREVSLSSRVFLEAIANPTNPSPRIQDIRRILSYRSGAPNILTWVLDVEQVRRSDFEYMLRDYKQRERYDQAVDTLKRYRLM